jgi:hypothetical protein
MLANYTLLRISSAQIAKINGQNFDQPFADRLMAFLVNKGGISQKAAQFLRQQLDPNGTSKGMSPHSTRGTKVRQFFERRLWSSPFLMEFVVRMFWHDFRLLGFPLPEMGFTE